MNDLVRHIVDGEEHEDSINNCGSDHLPEHLSFFTYIGIHHNAMKALIFLLTICVAVSGCLLLRKASIKLKGIRSIDIRHPKPELDTYCLTSTYIIRWIQVQLCLVIILGTATFVLLTLPEMNYHLFKGLILFIYRPLIYLSMMCYMQVYLCMTAEQLIIRFLILFERDKDINEVTFIYNNTNDFLRKEAQL